MKRNVEILQPERTNDEDAKQGEKVETHTTTQNTDPSCTLEAESQQSRKVTEQAGLGFATPTISKLLRRPSRNVNRPSYVAPQ